MKNYKAPELEVIRFAAEDIITTSGGQATVKLTVADGSYDFDENATGAEMSYGEF